jgi:hypothetical protein
MQIIKNPEFENDDYLIRLNLNDLKINDDLFIKLENIDVNLAKYYQAKRIAFKSKDTRPNIFAEFANNRPSLNSLKSLPALTSTIYTVACERNNGDDYESLIKKVSLHLKRKPNTRRCVLRFANSFLEYYDSELVKSIDSTCLNLIHYFGNSPKLVFRASDVTNELLVDILTIVEFFIQPVYGDQNVHLSIYASTSQNIEGWNCFIKNYKFITGG